MAAFAKGTKVQVTSHPEKQYIGVIGTVYFQMQTTLGVEGLVCIEWIPKGKRKAVEKAFHSSHLMAV
jgi:RNase P/RNase MRP subunit p29